mgnify:CR=1 FL=1
MDKYFDIENAIKEVKSKRIKKYLQEVLSTYHNCEYRSCIVMLYATTFADALEKIKTMSEVYQNEKAAKFLEKYEENRKANKAYSALERDVKDFIVESGLINDVEKKQWEHLKDYRDYCAHPVVEKDYELISPNAEQVRMHIRNMFEALFMKDAILTDSKLFEEFICKIESFYDRNGLDELEEYVNTRYICRLNLKMKGKFIKNLWKFAFYIDNEECDKYRLVAYRAMIWIIQSDRSRVLEFIEKNIEYFNGRIYFQDISLEFGDNDFKYYENKTLSLLYFLYKVPEVYKMLSGDNQTEIKSISRKNINLQLISPYLYETSKEHVNTLLENINGLNNCLDTNLASDLFKQAYSQFDYEYNNLVIFYFYNCQNSSRWSPDWDYVNWTYRDLLSDSLPYFTPKQMHEFLLELSSFYVQATSFKSMAKQIVAIVKEKGYEIDFSNYDIDLTKYVDI